MRLSVVERFFRFLCQAALTLGLCACANLSSQQGQEAFPEVRPESFTLAGRFSFRCEERNYHGRLDWQRVGASDAIRLSSPFGQAMAEMTVNDGGARLLLADGASHEADRVEALTDRLFGYPLSLEQLARWVAGRSKGGGSSSEDDADLDSLGRLHRLRHEGWIVDYGYEDGGANALPTRIIATRAEGNVELRLKIDAWTSAPPATVRAHTAP